MKVRLSLAARTYMRTETAYLRRESPSGAKSFTKRMRKARENIGIFNGIGSESRELPIPIPNMRRLIVGDYFMDYESVTRNS
jgi:plasmid stabilization system protein ParE